MVEKGWNFMQLTLSVWPLSSVLSSQSGTPHTLAIPLHPLVAKSSSLGAKHPRETHLSSADYDSLTSYYPILLRYDSMS